MMRNLLTGIRFVIVLFALLYPALMVSCAVMSDEIRQEALSDLPFDELVRKTNDYRGRTVILGGYVISVENHKDHTQMVALQAPLGAGQQPKSKDYSKGRLILIHDGFIDPEVFTKDRQITVGGTLMDSSATRPNEHAYPYLQVKVKEIHLWPKPEAITSDPFWDDDCYPYGWWRYRYRHSPWCW